MRPIIFFLLIWLILANITHRIEASQGFAKIGKLYLNRHFSIEERNLSWALYCQ